MQNRKIIFTVTKEYHGKTLERFLRDRCGVSAGLLRTLKREENGLLKNGTHVRSIDILADGDMVSLLVPPQKSEILPVKMNINILFEDEHIIVLEKPPFMPVHPVHGYVDSTLANFVAYHMEEKNEQFVMRFINRLDRNTSGIVIVAKNAYCAPILQRNNYKEYTAVCEGSFPCSMEIDLPIRLKKGHMIEREVGEGGKPSKTICELLGGFGANHSLLRLVLKTGRTHQIRVHLSHLGFPLAGDDLYGGSTNLINRQALHCSRAVFNHPITHKEIEISSKLPDDIKAIEKSACR